MFFFNDTATPEIYTLSLHDALPILRLRAVEVDVVADRERQGQGDLGEGDQERLGAVAVRLGGQAGAHVLPQLRPPARRSEEHTSELQSRQYLACRLLLEKK